MTATTLTPTVQFAAAGTEMDFGAWFADNPGILAIDTETTGLDTFDPTFQVRQVAYGVQSRAAIVIDGTDVGLVRSSLRAAAAAGRKLWAHNASYDAAAIRASYGVELRGIRCSQVFVKTLDATLIDGGRSRLKELRPATEAAQSNLRRHYASIYGEQATAHRDWLANAVRDLPADDPYLLDYVAVDAIECARLVADWAGTVDQDDVDIREAVAREQRVEDLWRWPSARGYLVDRDRLTQEQAALDAAREAGIERWGIDLIRDTNDTRHWLARRGIVIMDTDDKNTLSHKFYKAATVPAEAAEDWAEFTALRAAGRDASKLKELQEKTGADLRIHPSIRGIGARTGRMSVGKPALQNLPAHMRSVLKADPGMVLVGCDLKSVEPRVMAAVSGDPDLAEAVKVDVYTTLAQTLWGEHITKESPERSIAKTAFLALLYGKGARTLAVDLGISESEAQDVKRSIQDAYPVMARWMKSTQFAAKNGHALRTLYGRPLPTTQHAPYRAVNWTIQGSAADLFKDLTIAVADELGADTLWLAVHDELVVQVPEADVDHACEVLSRVMATEINGVFIDGDEPKVLGAFWGKA